MDSPSACRQSATVNVWVFLYECVSVLCVPNLSQNDHELFANCWKNNEITLSESPVYRVSARGRDTPKCTASVCVVGMHCWEILLGVSRSRERDLLSVLLIYPRIFLHVFIAYRLLVGFLFVWLCSAIYSCVLVVLVKLSVLAKWLAIERHPDDIFMRWGDYLHKAQVDERVCVYFSFVWFVYVDVCSPQPCTIYISYAYDMI